jgi:hypothetical protein
MNKDSKLLAEAYGEVSKPEQSKKVYVLMYSNPESEEVRGIFSTYEAASVAQDKLGPKASIWEYNLDVLDSGFLA